MTTLFFAVLTASLLGSLHCAGMCGPFCGIAVSGGKSWREAGSLQTAYHGGRLATYALLGAVAGAMGALVDLASTLAGLQPIALGLAGGAMILVGLAEIARLRGWNIGRWGRWKLPMAWAKLLQSGQRFAARRSGVSRALTIGLLTTLLPCGWLYAFVLTAAGAGSPTRGALVMAAFWLGTLPVLLSLGAGVRQLAGVFGERLPVLTSVALVVVGLITLSGRLTLSPEVLAATISKEASQSAEAIPDPTDLPACCRTNEAAQ